MAAQALLYSASGCSLLPNAVHPKWDRANFTSALTPLRETAQKTQYMAALVDGVLGLFALDERVGAHRIEPFSCSKTSAVDLPYVRRD